VKFGRAARDYSAPLIGLCHDSALTARPSADALFEIDDLGPVHSGINAADSPATQHKNAARNWAAF
jgi:hypothetical protein